MQGYRGWQRFNYNNNINTAGWVPRAWGFYKRAMKPMHLNIARGKRKWGWGSKKRRYFGIMPGETKFIDHDVDASPTTAGAILGRTNATATAGTLLVIPAGTSESERVGRKIRLTAFQMRYSIILGNTTTPTSTSSQVRIMVILDKQCNGTAPTVGNVLEFADYQSYRNLSKTTRFNILYDRCHALNSVSGSYDGSNDQFGQVVAKGQCYRKLHAQVQYNADTGVLTSMTQTNLCLLLISDNTFCNFKSKIRIRYKDE